MSRTLSEVIERANSWPDDARQELVFLAGEIERELNSGSYHASREELRGIDLGLSESAQGRFASEEAVEAVFTKHRRG